MPLPTLSRRVYERLTFTVLFALGFIIVTGAAVRLTSSGLGCSQWPNCEEGQLVAELELNPMIEQINRGITGLVSLLVIVAVLGSLAQVPKRRDLTLWSIGLVVGVLAQILLGAYVVFFGLAPIFVTAHFLVSIVLVWNGVVLYRRASQPDGPPVLVVAAKVLPLARVLLGLAIAALVTGTLVTGAGPHAGDEKAPRYDFAIDSVVRLHSVTVWLFLLAAVLTVWQLARAGAPAQVDRNARLLVGAILVQGALGYAQYFSGVPAYMVIFHVLGSVLVFVSALALYLSLFTRAHDQAPEATGTPRDPSTGDRMVVS